MNALSLTHSFNQYLLNTSYVPVKLLDAVDTAMNIANKAPDLMGFKAFSVGDGTINITINKITSATGKCYEEVKQDDVVQRVYSRELSSD